MSNFTSTVTIKYSTQMTMYFDQVKTPIESVATEITSQDVNEKVCDLSIHLRAGLEIKP